MNESLRDLLRQGADTVERPQLEVGRLVAEAERRLFRRRLAVVSASAAAVVVVVAGGVALRPDDQRPSPAPPGPVETPTTTPRTQSPQTWVDTTVTATDGYGWEVPDPVEAARDAWFAIVAEHLDPKGERLVPRGSAPVWGGQFEWPRELPDYSFNGRIGLVVDREVDNLFDDGCRVLGTPTPSNGTASCSTERFALPGGERARISRWGRRCGAFDGDPAAYVTCGDFRVAVAVERRDGLIGFVEVDGRGTPEFNPFPAAALAAAAADPRLTLPEAAYAVPSDQAVASVVEDHFPGYRAADHGSASPHHPGYAHADGKLRRRGVSVQVWPAGEAPTCGRTWLIECVERRVYGADDPTTVYVGAWDEEDWADCCPRNSRADSRVFVYVGPRHTVVVSEHLVVRADEEPLSADLDQRMIDLALDPRLQAAGSDSW